VAQGFLRAYAGGSRRRAVALTRAWPELAASQMGAGARRSQDRYGARGREKVKEATTTEEDEGEWGQPRLGPSYF
jgi:hypothetical protein